MSSAFDTVDHDILLHHLRISFGVTSKALDWIMSYLSGRTQSVVLFRYTTISKVILYGITQGSVLGAILFLLYITDQYRIIEKQSHFYTDDCHIYSNCQKHLETRTNDEVLHKAEMEKILLVKMKEN